MRNSQSGIDSQTQEGAGDQRCLNSELWHACAGPLVSLPAVGSRVVYFPQGHSEQVAASTNKEIDNQIPNYPSLTPRLICLLHNVTMHADVETDEVYAQMTLQPLSPEEQKDPYHPAEMGGPSKQPTKYFCKTLTASDTSTHGGFSVPRRAAEKVFPPLDYSQQPPAQELIARDLHDTEWKFRHIFRGQPKRHLLTTGWSVFVSAKKLVAGDSVLFIWNENNQLLLGIRHAKRPQTVMPSSVLSSDSMHIGLLAAAAHAAATSSRFTIFYNPRASPSEFVIPLAKYVKAVYHTHVSIGMRFRMLFETEESSVRRYMGTITGISDLDPVRWPNSHWRSLKVGWDESAAGERQSRTSLWEIEPLTTFPMYPSAFSFRLKRPWPSGIPGGDIGLNSPFTWLRDDGDPAMQPLNFNGLGVSPLIQPSLGSSMVGLQPEMYQAMPASALQDIRTVDPLKQPTATMLEFQPHNLTSRFTPFSPSQMLQQIQTQPQNNLLRAVPESQGQSQTRSHFLQSQLQHCHSFNDQQQQQRQQQNKQLEQHLMPDQQIPYTNEMASQSRSQSPRFQSMSSFCQQKDFAETDGEIVPASGLSPLHSFMQSFPSEETSNLLSLPRSNSLTGDGWPSKRLAVESFTAKDQCVSPQLDSPGPPQPTVPPYSVLLPPFPGRSCLLGEECSTDTQSHLLFGGDDVNSSSLLVQNDLPNLQIVGREADLTSMPYATANFLSTTGSGFPFNEALTSTSCLEESGFGRSSDNIGQFNEENGTFVKVYKSGSFGRSLDITKFSSYLELRGELGRLFGLERQLEDPLRSGWQLVFVDRENDVLLIGDDPWQDFVNNVWCIKILSPQEVQEMCKEHGHLLNSDGGKRLSSSRSDDYVTLEDSRYPSSGVVSVSSLDY